MNLQRVTELFSLVLVFQSLGFGLIFFGIHFFTRRLAKKYIGWFMLAGASYFAMNWMLSFGYHDVTRLMYPITLPLLLCQLPCFYWYIRSLTTPGYKAGKNLFYHLLPAIIILLLNSFFYWLPYEQAIAHLQNEALTGDWHSTRNFLVFINRFTLYIVLPFQLLFYVMRFQSLIREYRMRIEEQYSFREMIDLKWMRYLLIGLVGIFVINDITYLFRSSFPFLYSPLIFTVGMIVINFYIGYHVLIQAIAFHQSGVAAKTSEKSPQDIVAGNEEHFQPESVKYQRSALKPEMREVIIRSLTGIMEQEELFTNPHLSIDEVSKRLNINSKYLSQSINETYHQNFYTYINELRIAKAKHMLMNESHVHYSVEGIASQVGFQSKSSFYAAFKKSTGMTPAGFREQKEIRKLKE